MVKQQPWFQVSRLSRSGSGYLRSLKCGRRKRLQQRQVSQELRRVQALEVRTLLTQVNFLNMIAEVSAHSDDDEFIGAFLRGSATIDIQDTPTQLADGRDVVQTEIVSMNLLGFDSFNGPLVVRVNAMTPSTGTTAERQNTHMGQIDTEFNVDSFFNVQLEVDAFVENPMNPAEEILATLYGTASISTGAAGADAVPVAPGGTMSLIQSFDLFLDTGQTAPAGFTVDELDLTFDTDFTSIQGQKWHDLDSDGVKDTGEPGLDNWVIVAIDLEDNVPVDAQVTRSIDLDNSGTIDPDTEQGLYSFDNLPPGEYFITEMQQAGWAQTFPGQIPAGELPDVGPGTNWIQDSRQGNDFLTIGMLATFDWDNDGQGDEVVFVQGDASIFAGNYVGGTDSVTVEVGEFDLFGESSLGPVHILTGDSNANNVNDGPLHLSGQFVQDPSDPLLADSFFDIFVALDVGNRRDGSAPDPSTVWTNTTAIHVDAEVDRLPPLGLPYQMTNGSPVQFFDGDSTLQAQLVDLRFTTFREELFDETVGYIYEVSQGQQIDNVLFGNRDLALGPFGTDYGDAPSPYPTLSVNNGASHLVDGKHFLGLQVDAEDDGQPDSQATGDDLNDPQFSITSDDEDGVLFPQSLVAGSSSTIVVVGSPFATDQLVLNAWLDFDGNGSWTDAGEQIFTDQAISPGANQLPINVPGGVTAGAYVARFRVSTATGLSFDGAAPNGEVEDYLVPITTGAPPATDWGDAPDPFDATAGKYPTLLANNGAVHAIDGITVIGNFIDGETDGQPTATANGDDTTGLIDDEDGILATQQLAIGDGGLFEIRTLNGGFLNAWVDFNADGDWDDPNERIASDFGLGPGRNSLFASVPDIAAGTMVGSTFARFRLSPQPGEVSSPTGPAFNASNLNNLGFGEVEDIIVTIYQGEVSAEDEIWEVSVLPQDVPPSVGDVASGPPVGLTFLGTAPDIGSEISLLNQQWYWFSVDGGPVQRLDSLSLVNASGQFANPITLTYGDAAQGDPVQVDLTIAITQISDSEADVDTTIAITNLTGASISVDLFEYSDLNLNGTFGALDRATVVSASEITVDGIIGSTVTDQVTGGELPDHYQVGTVGADGIAFAFQSGTAGNLADSPAVGAPTAPGDIAYAFQWTRNLGVAGTVTIQKDRNAVAESVILPETFAGGFVSFGGSDGSSSDDSDGDSNGGFAGGTGGSSGFGGASGPGITNPQRFDPAFAIGYDFNATVNNFRSVELPVGVGDGQYSVSYLDDLNNPQSMALAGGVSLDFNTDVNVANGVSDFRVLGIEVSSGIDVADAFGFVTALSFVSETPFSFNQTGIPEFIYVSEDGRLREDIDVVGSLSVLETGDQGTWLPGTPFEEFGLTFGFTLFDSLTAAQSHISSNNYTGLSTIVTPPQPETVSLPAGGGSYEVLRDGGDLVVRVQGGADLFRRPSNLVSELTLTGSSDADIVTVLDSGGVVSTPISFSGEGGNDRFDASLGSGDDTINGGAGDDTILAGAGNDVVAGDAGSNELTGGVGTDTLVVRGNSRLKINASTATGSGNDAFSEFEQAILEAGAGNNRLDASAASIPVTLLGAGGNDTLLGGSQNDSLDGGAGIDFAELTGTNLVLTDGSAPGNNGDTLQSVEGLLLIASAPGSVIDASAYTLGSVTIVGSGGADTLLGGSSNDLIVAGGGRDSVSGGLGNDFIMGNSDSDTLSGGGGNDTILGGRGRDSIDGGLDSDLLIGGSNYDTISGGDGTDRILGGAGKDVLDGDDGDDTLFGGPGQDDLAGGLGNDTLNGAFRDDAFNQLVGRDTLIGGQRPAGRPAPVILLDSQSEPDSPQFLSPLSLTNDARRPTEETVPDDFIDIDEAFVDSLMPELFEM